MDYKISIKELENTPSKTLDFHFKEKIDGLDCVTPIASDLQIESLGDFIKVTGNVNGTVKLECDLCLEEFDYNLDFKIEEMLTKNTLSNDYGQEFELKDGQFATDLDGTDEIDIYDLLYQSVILNLPNKKVCGINCNGDKFLKEENLSDPRLDVFKNIQIEAHKPGGTLSVNDIRNISSSKIKRKKKNGST